MLRVKTGAVFKQVYRKKHCESTIHRSKISFGLKDIKTILTYFTHHIRL